MFHYQRLLRASAAVGFLVMMLTGCEIFNVPLLEIYSPTDGQTIEGNSVEVIGVARDGAGITRLVYVLSNNAGSSEERDVLPFYNVSTEEFRFTVDDLLPGSNRITVVASDAESTRGNVTVTVNVPDGSVLSTGEFDAVILEPTDGAVIRGDRLGVIGEITGNEIDLSEFTATYTVNGNAEITVDDAIDATSGDFAFAVEGLITGSNIVSVSIADGDGVVEKFDLNIDAEDGEAITSAITSPASGEISSAAPVNVTGTIDAVQSVGAISYSLNGGAAVSLDVDAAVSEGAFEETPVTDGEAVLRRFDYAFAIESDLKRGANLLEVTVSDLAGNAHTSSLTWTFNGESTTGVNTRLCATMITDGSIEVEGAPAWSGDFSVTKYGEPSAPTDTDAGPDQRGANLLWGGAGDRTTARQVIDLSSFEERVDSTLGFELHAYLGAFSDSPDTATIEVSFLDATDTILDTMTIDAVTASERGGVTALLERTLDGTLPEGTAKIELFIEFLDRDGDEQIDAFVDEVSLVVVNTDAQSCLVTIPAKGATISGSAFHALAVRKDGTVLAWGDNLNGQLGTGTTDNSDTPVAVAGIDGILAVATSDSHSLALDLDGRVYAWGDNKNGQLGLGADAGDSSAAPALVLDPSGEAPLVNVKAIAATRGLSFALTEDGRLYGWGDNASCTLGNPVGESVALPRNLFPNGATFEPVAIAAARGTLAILTADGNVRTIGSNEFGKLGLNDDREAQICVTNNVVDAAGTGVLSDVVALAAGSHHFLAQRADGTVVAWGANDKGQLGDDTLDDSLLPVETRIEGSVSAISATGRRSLAVTPQGALMAWGLNDRGQSVISSNEDLTVATPVAGVSNVAAAVAVVDGLLVLDASGDLMTAGDGAAPALLLESIMTPAE